MLKFKEIIITKLVRFSDNRGFFSESFNHKNYKKLGIDSNFVQDNHSISIEAGTIRGMHFQAPPFAQGKLLHCIQGAIFDVVVDIRKGSKTFGQWSCYELSAENCKQIFIPVGFAHGFLTLIPNTTIIYKCTNYYSPFHEHSLNWNDPTVGIDWPINNNPILSEKDISAPFLNNIKTPFFFGENC